MTTTSTITATYTITDIRKTFEGFEADLRMIARKTGKWSMSYVDNIFHDIIKLAEEEYLKSVDIALLDENDNPIRATKFIVNVNGTQISGDRAGSNDWTDLPNTKLTVILSHTDSWNKLTDEQREQFKQNNEFKISWTASKIDNNFPNLAKSQGQLYASKGYELKKENYK